MRSVFFMGFAVSFLCQMASAAGFPGASPGPVAHDKFYLPPQNPDAYEAVESLAKILGAESGSGFNERSGRQLSGDDCSIMASYVYSSAHHQYVMTVQLQKIGAPTIRFTVFADSSDIQKLKKNSDSLSFSAKREAGDGRLYSVDVRKEADGSVSIAATTPKEGQVACRSMRERRRSAARGMAADEGAAEEFSGGAGPAY